MIFQPHIGFTSWFDPKQNIEPETSKIDIPEEAGLGIAIANSEDYYPKSSNLSLPIFDKNNAKSFQKLKLKLAILSTYFLN